MNRKSRDSSPRDRLYLGRTVNRIVRQGVCPGRRDVRKEQCYKEKLMGNCGVTLQLMSVVATMGKLTGLSAIVLPYLLRQHLLSQSESTDLNAQTQRCNILGLNGVMSFMCL